MKTVVVTGAAGEVATGVLPFLKEQFTLRLVDVRPPPGEPNFVPVDLFDWQALAHVMQGADAVLHLAVAAGHSGTYEDDAFNDVRWDVNVKGTYHVFETARRCQVPRLVHVSSAMVTWGLAKEVNLMMGEAVAGEAAASPVGTYALTKAMAEEIAVHYAVRHRMNVITVRITAPLDVSRPDWKSKPVRPQQIPFPDLAQALGQALTVPLQHYEVVTVAGKSSRCRWSLLAAQKVLGYSPAYNLDELGLEFLDPFAVEKT
jgi:uronate dehydrogenase